MMEMGAQHLRPGGVRGGRHLALQRLRVGQQAGGHAAKVRQHMPAGCGVHGHLWDPPDDQPDPDELPPQLLLPPPLAMRAPGELAPVVASTTTTA
jgi:hypothetical protein